MAEFQDMNMMKQEYPDPSDDFGESGPPTKRMKRGSDLEARFLLQSKNAGSIIGKGGSNINRLRKDFKAGVTLSNCPGPERVLAISGDIDVIGEVLLDITPKLDCYVDDRTQSFDCEVRMLMHQSHAGCVIGRGGTRIKEIREMTGANVRVFSNCCPASTERIAQITGSPRVVVSCVKEICQLLNTTPIKGPKRFYDPLNYDAFSASEYGGYGDPNSPMKGGRGSGGPPPWQQGSDFGGGERGRMGRGGGDGWGRGGQQGSGERLWGNGGASYGSGDDGVTFAGGNSSSNSGSYDWSGEQGGFRNGGYGDSSARGGGGYSMGGMGNMGGSMGGSMGGGMGSMGGGMGSMGGGIGGSMGSMGGGMGGGMGNMGGGMGGGMGTMGGGMGGGMGTMGGGMRGSMSSMGGGMGNMGGGMGNMGGGMGNMAGGMGNMGGSNNGGANQQDNFSDRSLLPMSGRMGGGGVPCNFEADEPLGSGQDAGPVRMKIAKSMAGALIGKGGQRIRKMRMDSGASITIEEAAAGENERTIIIAGSPMEVRKARSMIQMSLQSTG